MSSIAIVVEKDSSEKKALTLAISRALGIAPLAVRRRIANGEAFVTPRLVNTENRELAEEVVVLLETLEQTGCGWSAFEVPDFQSFDPTRTYFSVNASTLRNILKSSDEIRRRQQELTDLECDDVPE